MQEGGDPAFAVLAHYYSSVESAGFSNLHLAQLADWNCCLAASITPFEMLRMLVVLGLTVTLMRYTTTSIGVVSSHFTEVILAE